MTVMHSSQKWVFRPLRWWVCLAFWGLLYPLLISLFVIDPRSTTPISLYLFGVQLPIHGEALTSAILIVFAFACAMTERKWSAPMRILWVIGVYILSHVLSIAALAVGSVAKGQATYAGYGSFDSITARYLASIPLLIWAMRRSTMFVQILLPRKP
jgi:hypothetical protein